MNPGVVPTLFCSKCGTPTPANAQFCNRCGQPLPVANAVIAAPVYAARYGGFWIRVVAFIIDALIVGAASAPLFFMTMGHSVLGVLKTHGEEPDPAAMMALAGGWATFQLASLAVNWLYEALMLCSEWQATVGKMVVGLKVTDSVGQPISFGRATGRHFAKLISGAILGIGYFMVAFTDRKQGLHDMMAGTLVVKK